MSHPSSPRRSRIAHFKAPFILSIAAPAALGLGCGGKAEADAYADDDPLVARNPPHQEGGLSPHAELQPSSPACEGDPPSNNTSFCAGPIWRCADGEWTPSYGSCNPPPPEDQYCEPALPVAGSDCAVPGFECSYLSECTTFGFNTATCVGGQWLVVFFGSANCNPPVVVPVCPERELVTGEGCAYEGQQCGPPACSPNQTSTSPRLVCSAGVWRDAPPPSCPYSPPDDSVPGDGAPDGGVPDGGS